MKHPPFILGSKCQRHLIHHLILIVLVSTFSEASTSSKSILESAAASLLKSKIDSSRSSSISSTAASLRGVTSSQVIEYNPRNIVLMTLLNSMLILGGLLGTMARNEKRLGSPFKRADGSLAKFKKRWLPKKFSKGSKVEVQGATTTEMPPVSSLSSVEQHHLPQHHQLLQHPLPQNPPSLSPPPIVEHQYYYPQEQGPPLQGPPPSPPPQQLPHPLQHQQPPHYHHHLQHPQQNHPVPHHLPQDQMFHPQPLVDMIDPRSAFLNSITSNNQLLLRRNDQQLPREHRSLSTSSSTLSSPQPPSSPSCGHVLRCLDPSGARLVEAHSPSELSQLALKLVNSSSSSPPSVSLLAKVRELIAFEEKGQCFLHYTCHNSKNTSSSTAVLNGRSTKKQQLQQQPTKTSSPAAN